jgi:hypothetical protein
VARGSLSFGQPSVFVCVSSWKVTVWSSSFFEQTLVGLNIESTPTRAAAAPTGGEQTHFGKGGRRYFDFFVTAI